ncbi:MAG: hypothetical protein KDE31_37945, partial [Caldilineaceae bacterium]|nr:hypothetical protein [Caldilineaceae bacterium]
MSIVQGADVGGYLADYVYNTDVETGHIFGTANDPNRFSVLRVNNDLPSGYFGAVVKDTQTGLVHLVNRGTDSLLDVRETWGDIAGGKIPEAQYQAAQTLISEYSQSSSYGGPITVTDGHSLGAYLAQILGVQYGWDVFGTGAPGAANALETLRAMGYGAEVDAYDASRINLYNGTDDLVGHVGADIPGANVTYLNFDAYMGESLMGQAALLLSSPVFAPNYAVWSSAQALVAYKSHSSSYYARCLANDPVTPSPFDVQLGVSSTTLTKISLVLLGDGWDETSRMNAALSCSGDPDFQLARANLDLDFRESSAPEIPGEKLHVTAAEGGVEGIVAREMAGATINGTITNTTDGNGNILASIYDDNATASKNGHSIGLSSLAEAVGRQFASIADFFADFTKGITDYYTSPQGEARAQQILLGTILDALKNPNKDIGDYADDVIAKLAVTYGSDQWMDDLFDGLGVPPADYQQYVHDVVVAVITNVLVNNGKLSEVAQNASVQAAVSYGFSGVGKLTVGAGGPFNAAGAGVVAAVSSILIDVVDGGSINLEQ